MESAELKAIRIRMHLTQAELADRLDLTPTTISRWEMQSNAGRYPIPEPVAHLLRLWAEGVDLA